MLHRRRPIPIETAFGSMVVIDQRNTSTSCYIYTLRCRDCGREKTLMDMELRMGGIPRRAIVNRVRCGCIRSRTVEENAKAIEEAAKRTILKSYRNNAKRYRRPFTLTNHEFWALLTRPCFYCGTPPANAVVRTQGTFLYNGIDRADSKGGYTRDNAVPCCWPCNRAKRDQSQADFIAWIDRCYAHLHKEDAPYDIDD